MNFKDKIRLHNEGQYDFTGELIDLALSPSIFKTTMELTIHNQPYMDYTDPDAVETVLRLPRWRVKYSEGKTYEEKLARNFKVMIAEYIKKANGIRKKNLFEGTQGQLMVEGQDPLHFIYSKLIEYGYHCYKDDFDKLPLKKIYKDMEKKEGFYAMDEFEQELKPFLTILPRINREKKKLQDQYIPLIEEALNEILPKVNLENDEMAIIGFIAISVRNYVSRALTKILDSKVHQIDGKRYFLTKEEIRAKGFNKTKANFILQVDTGKLKANQYVFFDTLCRRIEEECKANNTDPFTFNEDGEPIGINKRYFAMRMSIEESAFKHRLRRLPLLKNKPTDYSELLLIKKSL